MKMKFKILFVFIFIFHQALMAQDNSVPEIYLLTCGPGTETYSVYGHSALRVVIPAKNTDTVYNWGVFDFNTPNFVWKFAKGRLNYSLGVYSYETFLRDYYLEQRWVISQKINLELSEIERLFILLTENLKPENITYRYDFLYDNCSTRIRDILEKSVGSNLYYQPDKSRSEMPTFRDLIGEYEKGYIWTKMGIDLLLGSPVDKKASFRDRMFLPIEMKNALSASVIKRMAKMVPLLQDPEVVLDFDSPEFRENSFTSPLFLFSMLLIILILATAYFRSRTVNNAIDITLYSIFSILALTMIFFNFFTDHQQTRWNLNILWLNPFIILCLISIIYSKNWTNWFRTVFYLALGFLFIIVIIPQEVNKAYIPVIVSLILRSSIRSGFKWNPFTLPYLTEL
jgi:hypothetical protein